jgi:hypothetical protein
MRFLVLVALLSPSLAAADVGVGADVGVPDGAVASVVVRPIRPIRVSAGISHNYVSPGVRAGVTLVPLRSWFSPTLSFDVGHYRDGDANPLARMLTGDAMFSERVLERVGYDYANAHFGLELGRKRCTFFVHAGASRITTAVHGLGSETVTFTEDPRIRAWTPSARLGLILYLP